MKRVFTVLWIVALMMAVLSTTFVHAALQGTGDVNGDGKVNNRDLGYLQLVLNNDVEVKGDADVNADDKVNNQDLGLLQLTLNGEERVVMLAPATKYVSLGAPAAKYYPNNKLARCAWDMAIHGDRLYVGCGDYSRNTGDSPILSCALNDLGNWVEETTISEEQVGRFVNIGGVLTIPGFDPVGAAQYGSYYELLDGEWVQQATLPFGLHNFDIAWYQGRMYAAVGADRGEYPIAYTEDGLTYQTIALYKNGQPVDTGRSEVVRSSNLYVLNDELYADFWYEDETQSRAIFEMYHYNVEEDRFDYVANLKESTHGGKYSSAYLPLWEKQAVNDKMFLTTGYLFYTTDFEKYTQVLMPSDAMVYDMEAFGGRLYLLTAYESGGQYKVTVYSTTAADPTDLRTEATYTYALMPTSFAVNASNFFIGMGNWHNTGSDGNGTILQVKR